mmetsp:Transcript_5491/g.9086  ORF Transcript_5491/g.9086 Transcript_5491/m.9086 type:complete len:222 (-) Transcript_5491:77-742(-)
MHTDKPSPQDGMESAFREIRALHDETTVRVYQAYNDEIADAAVAANSFQGALDAGVWSLSRMSWVKPSAVWMAYRCGWTTLKDKNQRRVLALDLSRPRFEELLMGARLSHRPALARRQRCQVQGRVRDGAMGPRAGDVPRRRSKAGAHTRTGQRSVDPGRHARRVLACRSGQRPAHHRRDGAVSRRRPRAGGGRRGGGGEGAVARGAGAADGGAAVPPGRS